MESEQGISLRAPVCPVLFVDRIYFCIFFLIFFFLNSHSVFQAGMTAEIKRVLRQHRSLIRSHDSSDAAASLRLGKQVVSIFENSKY